MIREASFLLCAVLLGANALAQDDEISFKSTELAPGLYMLEGQGGFAGGNLSLLTGDDGIVLIDDGIEPLVATTLAAIEKLTAAPVDFVVNTHSHGDHTGANAALHQRGATIVAHEKLRERMISENAAREALPELTYNGSVTFHLNGLSAHVFHVPNAHTDGDSIIHFPEVNVIHAGDVLFNRLFPFIDLDGGGSVAGFMLAQEILLNLADDATKIVAGHGDLASKADVQAALEMLVDAETRVKDLVDAGMNLDQVKAENPLANYHDEWNWGFITTERMTETLYRAVRETGKD
jgi:glyoxylase-like metal-dependent hydrolase (beta-lactamase superfamily II)